MPVKRPNTWQPGKKGRPPIRYRSEWRRLRKIADEWLIAEMLAYMAILEAKDAGGKPRGDSNI